MRSGRGRHAVELKWTKNSRVSLLGCERRRLDDVGSATLSQIRLVLTGTVAKSDW